jgi:hypothetical protein
MTENTADLNLTTATHRASASVWERQGWDGSREPLALTRWLVGIGGAALAIQGMRQRTLIGGTLAGIGGTLAWWALTGEGDLSHARRWFLNTLERMPWCQEDLVHEASDGSFPASDPPSATAIVGTGLSSRNARP